MATKYSVEFQGRMKRRTPRKPVDPCRPAAPDMKAARAWMAARGIDQPRGIVQPLKVDMPVSGGSIILPAQIAGRCTPRLRSV